MKKAALICTASAALIFGTFTYASDDSSAGSVYIISPQDGATVQGPVTIKFGLSGYGIAPAGVDKENTGHHHLLVNSSGLPAKDAPIPKDDSHIHFGGGQTETTLKLAPGKHVLKLVLGDKDHKPIAGMESQTVTINVTE